MFLVYDKITHLHRLRSPGPHDTGKGHLPINFQGGGLQSSYTTEVTRSYRSSLII